ncbi:unnamed protein product [Caenorhabditis brenneri]
MVETSEDKPIATMENMPPEMLDEILGKLEPIDNVLTNQNLQLAELRLLCADPVFAKIHELVVRNELTNLRTEHLIITTDFMYPALTTIFNALNYNNLQLNYIAEHILDPNLQLLERRFREIFEQVPAGTLLTSNVLEYCFLSAKYDIDDVIEFLTDEAHLQENEDVFVVEIPDKNERYTVELFENEIEITRSGN